MDDTEDKEDLIIIHGVHGFIFLLKKLELEERFEECCKIIDYIKLNHFYIICVDVNNIKVDKYIDEFWKNNPGFHNQDSMNYLVNMLEKEFFG